MTVRLSSRGKIVIPKEIRDRYGMRRGDHFIVEDDPSNHVITLRKVKLHGNWFEVYMQCPASFGVLPRCRRIYNRRDQVPATR